MALYTPRCLKNGGGGASSLPFRIIQNTFLNIPGHNFIEKIINHMVAWHGLQQSRITPLITTQKLIIFIHQHILRYITQQFAMVYIIFLLTKQLLAIYRYVQGAAIK